MSEPRGKRRSPPGGEVKRAPLSSRRGQLVIERLLQGQIMQTLPIVVIVTVGPLRGDPPGRAPTRTARSMRSTNLRGLAA